MNLSLKLYFCRSHQPITHYVYETSSVKQLTVVLFSYEVFRRCRNYVFQSETIKFQNFDAMEHRRLDQLKPNQNWILWTRTRHLKLWKYFHFFLDSLRSTAFDSQLNYRPELNYQVSEYPFQAKWKYVNIHKRVVASILSI